MDCPLTSPEWESVCKNWHNFTYCNSPPKNIQFTADLSVNNNEKFGDCTYFKISSISFEDGAKIQPKCPSFKERIATVCEINCNYYKLNDLTKAEEDGNNDVVGMYQFWMLLLLLILGWSAQAVVVSVGDTICFALLGKYSVCFLL